MFMSSMTDNIASQNTGLSSELPCMMPHFDRTVPSQWRSRSDTPVYRTYTGYQTAMLRLCTMKSGGDVSYFGSGLQQAGELRTGNR